MSAIDVIILVLLILSGTFAGVFLFVSLLLFQTPPSGKESDKPFIAYLPFLDLIWGMAAPFFYWRENRAGRKYMYAFAISLAVFMAAFHLR